MSHTRSTFVRYPILALSLCILGGTSVQAQPPKKAATPPGNTQVTKKATARQAGSTAPRAPRQGVLMNNVSLVSMPSKLGGSTEQNLADFDMRLKMAGAWNAHRAKVEPLLRKKLADLGLHDIAVHVAAANLTAKASDKALYYQIYPAQQTFAVTLTVPGNTVSASIDRPYWFDPSMSGKFDLMLTMICATTGKAVNPVFVKSSSIAVHNFQHGVLDLSIDGAAQSFGKATVKDPGMAYQAVTGINTKLTPYTQGRGLSHVAPSYRAAGLNFKMVFELSAPLQVTPPPKSSK